MPPGCGVLFFGAFILFGVGGLAGMVFGMVMPEWRVNHRFVEGRCVVLAKRLGESSGENGPTYRPEIHVRYTADGRQREAWTYDIHGLSTGGRAGQEAILAGFAVGGQYPSWAKDARQAPINARAETAAEKPTFRSAFRKRRCLVPADGFYEWATLGGRKRPFCFRPWADRPLAFAGLWERWNGPEGPVESCAILTTGANELVRPVHDRMPVILPERHWGAWLDPTIQGPGELSPLLRPFPADALRAYPVGDPRDDGPQCLAPAL
jgi:putative SOS response-associated peptidase YedK